MHDRCAPTAEVGRGEVLARHCEQNCDHQRSPRGRYTREVRVRPIDLVDVLAYLVVLGVFIQLFPEVISESFLLALLTAILLKLVLE